MTAAFGFMEYIAAFGWFLLMFLPDFGFLGTEWDFVPIGLVSEDPREALWARYSELLFFFWGWLPMVLFKFRELSPRYWEEGLMLTWVRNLLTPNPMDLTSSFALMKEPANPLLFLDLGFFDFEVFLTISVGYLPRPSINYVVLCLGPWYNFLAGYITCFGEKKLLLAIWDFLLLFLFFPLDEVSLLGLTFSPS